MSLFDKYEALENRLGLVIKIIGKDPLGVKFDEILSPTRGEIDGKEISDINIDANDRLWIGIANADNPGIYVLDTDINTINGEFIELEMPVKSIEFLTVQ